MTRSLFSRRPSGVAGVSHCPPVVETSVAAPALGTPAGAATPTRWPDHLPGPTGVELAAAQRVVRSENAEAAWVWLVQSAGRERATRIVYALTLAKRLKAMGQARYQNDGDPRTSGPGFGLTLHPEALDEPLRWRKPRRVFVNSMSDLFHADVNSAFIGAVFDVMARCPQHTFQVLTKRPQRMAALLRTGVPGSPAPLPNVWLGTSIESDRYAFRADHLRATPAAVRFLSLEPLLGPLPSLDLTGIDWVIVGGESGPGARPMHPDWVRDIRDHCVAAGVPFFFKQWGAWASREDGPLTTRHGVWLYPDGRTSRGTLSEGRDGAAMFPIGKHAAGRVLDGRTWDEYPA